jgi:PST family polysaccharide transporter
LQQLKAPLDRTATPVLVRCLKEPEKYKRAYVNMVQLALVLLIPGLIFGFYAAEPLMSILLGPH